MWYFEELRDGQWRPRSSWTRPVRHPDPKQRAMQRGLTRVRHEHETMGIEELAAIYGAKAEMEKA